VGIHREKYGANVDCEESKSKVIRGGINLEVNSSELVSGDIILFKSGDAVTADARVLRCEKCSVNASAITGESLVDVRFLLSS